MVPIALALFVLHAVLFLMGFMQGRRSAMLFEQFGHDEFLDEVRRTESFEIISTANGLLRCYILAQKAEHKYILGSFALLAAFLVCFYHGS
jgi:hypothetical protein